MKKVIITILFIMGTVISLPASAENGAKTLGNCLVDSLNGKERKILARWIFLSMASHPDIKTYSKASATDVNNTDKVVGQLITRLLVDDCPSQLKSANKQDPLAVQKSFELVGKVAMQELMSNQNVMKAITNYAQYADIEKINAILANK